MANKEEQLKALIEARDKLIATSAAMPAVADFAKCVVDVLAPPTPEPQSAAPPPKEPAPAPKPAPAAKPAPKPKS